MSLPRVAAQQAFRWECPQCGRENFDRAAPVSFDCPEDEEEAKAALGVESWIEGGIVSVPDTVTCGGCLLLCEIAE